MSTPRPANMKVPVAFMSYAHHDDGQGRLSRFRERLEGELRSQTGLDLEIFKDSEAINIGEQWRRRLDEGLAASTFLLPIVTPSFLMSAYCREELETFCRHERELGRDDLILPVYYIDCEGFLSSAPDERAAATLRVILERQVSDWRDLRSLTPSDRRVEQARTKLAGQIRIAMMRAVQPPPETQSDVPADEVRHQRETSASQRDPLPACCVRIDVGGRHAGSGFFAAPGVVVTCHHVLRLGDLASDEAGATVSVISPSGGSYRVLDTRELSQADDLAILRVEPAHAHELVLLDTGLRARDALATFGFSDEHPNGHAAALVAQGWREVETILDVADVGIARGMSGSPVINFRTGAVCGILSRAGAGGGSGGHVISARRLFALSPTLNSTNFRHHTAHRAKWFDLLPAKQRKLLLAATSGPASLPGCLLVISVDEIGDEWEVRATVHRRDELSAEWVAEASLGPIEVDLNSVRALVARVFRDWASRDATEQGRVGPGEQIRLLGQILSHALLTAEIGSKFEELIATDDLGWLEVALHFSDVLDPDFGEFVQLPWEHLYVPPRAARGDFYFARDPKLAFVRTLHAEPVTPEPTSGKISLLVVAVRPRPQDGVDDGVEVDEIAAGLVELATELSGSLEVTMIESPGLGGLTDAVASSSYDAVHYVGFGRFDTGTDDRIALTVNASSRGGYHDGSDLGTSMAGDRNRMPRLVVLQVCRRGQAVPPDLAGFGPALLKKEGCHAVVANQYPVGCDLTKRFNAALYTALADGTPLEMAVQLARKKVWSSDSEGRAYLSPAVFVRNPGGLRLTPEGRETASRSRVGALSGHG